MQKLLEGQSIPPPPPPPTGEDKEDDEPKTPRNWFQVIVAFILYLIVLLIGYYFTTKESSVCWWAVALVAMVCHIALSIVVVNERQLGAVFLLGKPLGDIGSGPHFVFWPFCYIRKGTRNIIQLEIGVLTEEERKKAALLEKSESVYLLEDPFFVNWGGIDSVGDVTEEEKRRFDGNPYGKPMVTSTHLTVRYQVWSYTSLVVNAGGTLEAIELIRNVATAALIAHAGKSFVGRALANMEKVDDELKVKIEEFVADPNSNAFRKNPKRSWGVNIRKTQITRMGTARRISEAQADQGKTIYNAQAERFKTEEIAIGLAKATVLKAGAEKERLEKEGAGRAEAERLLLFAQKKGLEELANLAKLPEGQLVLQLQALERGLKEGKVVILPLELSKIVGSLGKIL